MQAEDRTFQGSEATSEDQTGAPGFEHGPASKEWCDLEQGTELYWVAAASAVKMADWPQVIHSTAAPQRPRALSKLTSALHCP